MSRVKVKQLKKMINVENGGNINEMFEEMMGVKDADNEIIRPKFVDTRNLLREIYKILRQFATFAPLQNDFPNIAQSLLEIKKFAEDMKDSVYMTDVTIEETEALYMKLNKQQMNELYKKLKENKHVRELIGFCSKLKAHDKYLSDVNNLKDSFIGLEPGLSYCIFPFSTLDLKVLWVSRNMSSMIKKYILLILHKLYKQIYEVYRITTSPDVDIDKFTKLLVDSIKQLKKTPGLNRCNNAFRRIENSVTLLKEKFDGYYRESIASANPNMIVESFIVDVSNQGGTDASLTREFRIIIQHMRKVAEQSGKSKDPKFQSLYKILNDSFKVMDNKNGASTSEEKKDTLDLTLETESTKETSDLVDSTTTESVVDVVESPVADTSPVKKDKRKNKKKKSSSVKDKPQDTNTPTETTNEHV
jgi:hypothetical protein